jgi:hypothetical protein
MQDSNPDNNLLTNFRSIVLLKVVVVLDELVEVLPLDQLGNDVDVRLALDAFLELEKKGVRHRLHNAALMAE